MRSVKLDFLHPQPKAGLLAWLLLVAGLVLAGWTVWQDTQMNHKITAETVEQQKLGKTAMAGNAARTGAASNRSGEPMVGEQLSLPWSELFVKLESVKSKDIALVSLEADGRKTEALLTAEARNFDAMLAWIESLKNQAGFRTVTLSSHALKEEDPQQPYRFVLRLGWRP